ncbi:MAG: hypothetical protein LUG49_03020 [Oscillospiraceae bacterium]|nr:hypothetical protein [Oscillospiraceae bacterium]
MKKRFLRALSAVLVILAVAISSVTTVFATTGSITVTVKYGDTILTDGVLTIYKVADENGDFVSEFANCGIDISDLESSTLPWLLWQWATVTEIPGASYLVGSDGTVTFPGLSAGIYLIVPSTNPEGYEVEPCVVPVPLNGEYDVEVIAKIEPSTPNTPTPTPTPTTTTVTEVTDPDVTIPDDDDPTEENNVEIEDDDDVEIEDEEETLPKTGQMNLPIPIMAGTGGVCIVAGLIVSKTDKKK